MTNHIAELFDKVERQVEEEIERLREEKIEDLIGQIEAFTDKKIIINDQ